jgi:hypothetical protein
MAYILPQVSINGTDRRDLIAQQLAVRTAAHALQAALIHALPHGRDYQYEPASLRLAIAESMADATALHAIIDRAEAVLDALTTTMPRTTSPSAAPLTTTEN